jgi:hypothetical protein
MYVVVTAVVCLCNLSTECDVLHMQSCLYGDQTCLLFLHAIAAVTRSAQNTL